MEGTYAGLGGPRDGGCAEDGEAEECGELEGGHPEQDRVRRVLRQAWLQAATPRSLLAL